MKPYFSAVLLSLSLIAVTAHAARDEALIQQTRKNQLAHDAAVKAERLAKQDKTQQEESKGAAGDQPRQAASATSAASAPAAAHSAPH